VYWYFSQPIVVIVQPELVKQILSTKAKSFWKDRDEVIIGIHFMVTLYNLLKDVIGNGLLLNNGDFWSKQRRLMVFFHSSV
jgi:hypothetical protein